MKSMIEFLDGIEERQLFVQKVSEVSGDDYLVWNEPFEYWEIECLHRRSEDGAKLYPPYCLSEFERVYELNFGKFSGRRICDVPISYLNKCLEMLHDGALKFEIMVSLRTDPVRSYWLHRWEQWSPSVIADRQWDLYARMMRVFRRGMERALDGEVSRSVDG